MMISEKQLGQLRPLDTNAASIFSPSSGETGIVKMITVCNTSNALAFISIYQDNDGTTYDESTALFYQLELGAKQTLLLEGFWPMANSTGNLAVQTSVANAVTFTVSGAERSV